MRFPQGVGREYLRARRGEIVFEDAEGRDCLRALCGSIVLEERRGVRSPVRPLGALHQKAAYAFRVRGCGRLELGGREDGGCMTQSRLRQTCAWRAQIGVV